MAQREKRHRSRSRSPFEERSRSRGSSRFSRLEGSDEQDYDRNSNDLQSRHNYLAKDSRGGSDSNVPPQPRQGVPEATQQNLYSRPSQPPPPPPPLMSVPTAHNIAVSNVAVTPMPMITPIATPAPPAPPAFPRLVPPPPPPPPPPPLLNKTLASQSGNSSIEHIVSATSGRSASVPDLPTDTIQLIPHTPSKLLARKDVIISRRIVGEQLFQNLILMRYPGRSAVMADERIIDVIVPLAASGIDDLLMSLAPRSNGTTMVTADIDALFSDLQPVGAAVASTSAVGMDSLDDLLRSVGNEKAFPVANSAEFGSLLDSLFHSSSSFPADDENEPTLEIELEVEQSDEPEVAVEMMDNKTNMDLEPEPFDDYDQDLYGDLGGSINIEDDDDHDDERESLNEAPSSEPDDRHIGKSAKEADVEVDQLNRDVGCCAPAEISDSLSTKTKPTFIEQVKSFLNKIPRAADLNIPKIPYQHQASVDKWTDFMCLREQFVDRRIHQLYCKCNKN